MKMPIRSLKVSSFTVPTDFPESDGTLEWDQTTLVLVEIEAGGQRGLGYTYAHSAVAEIIRDILAPHVVGADALSPNANYAAMWRAVRNLGRAGICSMAISAVDCALWDVKARLVNQPLAVLLGAVRAAVPVYGSGGFTSYSDQQLASQLANWVDEGIPRVKMKIGRDQSTDLHRIAVARDAIGANTELYVDANGAYVPRQAAAFAAEFARFDVRWFEEPVSSDDLNGMRRVRDTAPAMTEIAAGEYGYDIFYFQRMLQAQAVDVLQADITRCGGVTGLLQVSALCQACNVPLSLHTAPALHAHAACAITPLRHLEYFHDHVRIERMFFDGLPEMIHGTLRPDLSRPGVGLELKRADIERFAA